jgi:outer membrane protein assembly factor BamD (BamD/ComL family)
MSQSNAIYKQVQGMASRFVSAVKRLRPAPASSDGEQKGTAEAAAEASELVRIREAAERAMAEENWAEAVTQWKALMTLSGDRAPPRALVSIARALRHLEQFDDAEASLRQYLKFYPESQQLKREFAELAMAREDWLEAIRLYRGVLVDSRGDVTPSKFLRLSRAQRGANDMDAAEASLRSGLAHFPDDAKLAHELRAVIVAQQRLPDDMTHWAAPKVASVRTADGFIKSSTFRNNPKFVQASAFAMNFTLADATKELRWANECRLSWLEHGEEKTWLALREEEQPHFIEELLLDIMRGIVGRLDKTRPFLMGVSSGYDSRTLLSFLRRLGVTPETFTFGQVGNLDFDYMSMLSEKETLNTRLFDTSEIVWSLDLLDRYADQTQDYPISPRVPVNAILDAVRPHRLEVNGHLGDSLTGIRQDMDDSWEKALRIFKTISNRFNFQSLFRTEELDASLPKEPLVDRSAMAYARQLDMGFLEYQRMRPLDGVNVNYIFPFREPRWVGFWLNRAPSETLGQSLWIRFLHNLRAREFLELRDGSGRTRSTLLSKISKCLYGTPTAKGRIDLASAGKALPSSRSIHFCLFACYANNPHFRKMVEDSLGRLKQREIFDRTFVDDVFRHFNARDPNSDNMLNGLIALDVLTETGRFS